jgi:YVTN family beta-propeller protein
MRSGAALQVLLGLLFFSFSANARDYEVWVTNERGGDVTILNSEHQVVATVPVGKRPRGIQTSPDQKTIYVAVSGTPIGAPPKLDAHGNPIFAKKDNEEDHSDKHADGIVVIDVASRRVLKKLNAGSDPEQFALSKDGSRIYASNEDVGTASVLNLATGKVEQIIPLNREPEGVATTPDGKFFYVTCETEGYVYVIDASSFEPIAHIQVNVRPRSVAFLPDGSRAFVPSESTGKIHVIDNRSHRLINTVQLPAGLRPMCLKVSQDGKRLFASTGRGGSVAVLALPEVKLTKTIKVGARPWGIELSPDGRYLFAANGPSNDISIVDLKSEGEISRVPAGKSPWGVAVVEK